ncbi:MAG TPA: PKD domain-containing protein [Baekduia sp.]|nr:PKD domain-containing protein [Baekduia sp.]
MGAALAAASPGDTLNLKPGVFQEDALDVAKANLTIQAPSGPAAITSKAGTPAGTDVLKVSAAGVTLKGIAVGVPAAGGSAVVVAGTGAVLDSVALINQAASADVATLELGAPSGTTTVRSSAIVHTPTTGGNAPALQGAGASTLLLEGSQVVSGTKSGPALALPGNATDANRVVRSSLLAQNPAADAVRVTSAADSATAKKLVVDSSILAGGTSAAGLHVETLAAGGLDLDGSQAGDVDVDLFHATIAGAARSIDVDALANRVGVAPSTGVGNVDVRAERSIVHGDVTVENYDASLPLTQASNTAKVAIVESDSPAAASNSSGSTVEVSGNVSNTDAALFAAPAARVYLLRVGSPAIDKAGPVRAGEGDKDVEGEPRLTGPATDLGADEFANKPPLARLAVDPSTVRQEQVVTFDASRSVDPEQTYGGGLAQYRFEFGDGTSETSTSPKVQHAYKDVGSYQARVTVTDQAGATAASAPVTVQVADGVVPAVKVLQPSDGQRFNRFTTRKVRIKGSKRTRTVKRTTLIRFQGTASDASGLDRVELTIQLGDASGTRCRYLDPKKGVIVSSRCSAPVSFRVALRDGIWAYRTKSSTKLRTGVYRVTATAFDKTGNTATHAVRFRVR